MKFMPSGISEVCTYGASVETRMGNEESSSVGRGLAPAVGKRRCAFAVKLEKKGSTSSVVYDATFPKGEGLSRPYLLLLPSYFFPIFSASSISLDKRWFKPDLEIGGSCRATNSSKVASGLR